MQPRKKLSVFKKQKQEQKLLERERLDQEYKRVEILKRTIYSIYASFFNIKINHHLDIHTVESLIICKFAALQLATPGTYNAPNILQLFSTLTNILRQQKPLTFKLESDEDFFILINTVTDLLKKHVKEKLVLFDSIVELTKNLIAIQTNESCKKALITSLKNNYNTFLCNNLYDMEDNNSNDTTLHSKYFDDLWILIKDDSAAVHIKFYSLRLVHALSRKNESEIKSFLPILAALFNKTTFISSTNDFESIDARFIDRIIKAIDDESAQISTFTFDQEKINYLFVLLQIAKNCARHYVEQASFIISNDSRDTTFRHEKRDTYIDLISLLAADMKKSLKLIKTRTKELKDILIAEKELYISSAFTGYNVSVLNCDKNNIKAFKIKLPKDLIENYKLLLLQHNILFRTSKDSVIFSDLAHLNLQTIENLFKLAVERLKKEYEQNPFALESEILTENQALTQPHNITVHSTIKDQTALKQTNKLSEQALTDAAVKKAMNKKEKKCEDKKQNNILFFSPNKMQQQIDWGNDLPIYNQTDANCAVHKLYGDLDNYYITISPNLLEKIDLPAEKTLLSMFNYHNHVIPAKSKRRTGFILSSEDMSVQTKPTAKKTQALMHVKVKHCRKDERFFGHVVATREIDGKSFYLLEIDTYKPEHKKHGALYHYPSAAQLKNIQSNTNRAKK